MRSVTLLLLILTVCFSLASSGQNQRQKEEDRLVRLVRADNAATYQSDLFNIRQVTGSAQFIHNDALIICDTAIWDVTKNILDANGNVRIIQNQTILSGDKIRYIADSSLAQVRGHLVELTDKDKNLLRTHYLDYNTRDSIAFFYNGGSMKDTSGNIIESLRGFYYSQKEEFHFLNEVQMFGSDSLVMMADSLIYFANEDKIRFPGSLIVWDKAGYLSAGEGWYNRNSEEYLFNRDAYMATTDNEVWADTIYYKRDSSLSRLYNNVQILDTAQSVIFFADYAFYKEEPLYALLSKNPSIAHYSLQEEISDTLFFAADTITFRALTRGETDPATIASSENRYKNSRKDYIKEMFGKSRDSIPKTDSVTEAVQDTTLYRFIEANKNVRFYRSDFQGRCDSLKFNTIDSIIRLYVDPVLWNEQHQFTADSIQLVISEGRLAKADLVSAAFVISKEDSVHSNQIKATDIVAFFDQEGELSRFDAFGGVSLIFFFAEDSLLTTMNHKECKVMTATIIDNQIQRVRYFENIQSDAYPIIDLERDKKYLRGFKARDNERPRKREDIMLRKIRPSQKEKALMIMMPSFRFTNQFFGSAPEIPKFKL